MTAAVKAALHAEADWTYFAACLPAYAADLGAQPGVRVAPLAVPGSIGLDVCYAKKSGAVAGPLPLFEAAAARERPFLERRLGVLRRGLLAVDQCAPLSEDESTRCLDASFEEERPDQRLDRIGGDIVAVAAAIAPRLRAETATHLCTRGLPPASTYLQVEYTSTARVPRGTRTLHGRGERSVEGEQSGPVVLGRPT